MVVPSKKFSLYIADTEYESTVLFGGSDVDKYSRNVTASVTLTVNPEFFWSDEVTAWAIGSAFTGYW
jgi:hypothetical protein